MNAHLIRIPLARGGSSVLINAGNVATVFQQVADLEKKGWTCISLLDGAYDVDKTQFWTLLPLETVLEAFGPFVRVIPAPIADAIPPLPLYIRSAAISYVRGNTVRLVSDERIRIQSAEFRVKDMCSP